MMTLDPTLLPKHLQKAFLPKLHLFGRELRIFPCSLSSSSPPPREGEFCTFFLSLPIYSIGFWDLDRCNARAPIRLSHLCWTPKQVILWAGHRSVPLPQEKDPHPPVSLLGFIHPRPKNELPSKMNNEKNEQAMPSCLRSGRNAAKGRSKFSASGGSLVIYEISG